MQTKTSQTSQQQRISGNFLPTPATVETTVRSFYPTPRPSPKPSQSSQSVTHQVTQHIHVSPGVTLPQLKSHQITISLPPDIQRIVQNPSPLLPSQSRVIVTAKASVSDESGRPLNTSQLVTLPLPTVPASYDDYKEGDESFDPFYRDVPKIRKNRQNAMEKIRASRGKRSLEPYHLVYGDSHQDFKVIRKSEPCEGHVNKESARAQTDVDFRALKESLIKFRDILFSDELNEDSFRNDAGEIRNNTERVEIDNETFDTTSAKQAEDNTIKKVDYLEDLKTEASKHLDLNKNTDEKEEDEETYHEDSSSNVKINTNKSFDKEEHIKNTPELELEIYTEPTTVRSRRNESREDVIDVIILDSDNDFKEKATSAKTDTPIEIIIEEETKSDTRDASKTKHEKVAHREQIAGYLIKDESGKRLNSASEERQLTVPRETAKRKDAKNSGERKPGPRRKSSRSRSSRRRISSRIKQQRTENVEVTEATQQKEDMERATTTTVATVAVPSTTSTTTVIPSVASFKTKVVEQIDGNIFGESESRTLKEVDTRAVGQRDATYSKSLQDDISQDTSKNKELERSFDRQIVKDHARSSELRADKTKEGEQETELIHTPSTDKEDTTENPRSTEEAESTEVTRVSEEQKSPNEESSFKEYEFPNYDEEVNTSTNEGETEDSSRDDSSRISSDEVATSREGSLEQEESFSREDASERSSSDVSGEEQSSTARYSEEVNSEELNEYQDITESSAEGTRSIQEDYTETESTEGSTTLADYTNSEEYTDSQEDVAASTEEAEDSTEGVLKFTDELPISDDNKGAEMTEEISASNESGAHDYVDDNYEPENYKGTETTTKANDFEEDKNDEEKKDASARNPDRKNIETQRIDDSPEAETQTEYTTSVTEVENLQEIASLTTTTSAALITTTPATTTSTTTASTTTSSTTTTTTSTTRRPTTTTSRVTPPKLFKPTGNRRIYAYIPPTTTPIPVVIKPRVGLFNPKPAKPPKTYNELAPKPMIRKLVLSRKPITITAATTTTEKLNTENPTEMTTEPVTMTATTAAATTMTATTAVATTTLATTTMAATMEETTTEAATTTTTLIAESGRSEENGLESKLEANEHISLDPSTKNEQTVKEDQFSSPSEQNTPVNSSDVDSGTTTTEIEAFTPYPLSRLSTLASSVEQTTKEIDYVKSQETTKGTDILVTTAPSTTLLSEKSEHTKITSSTEKYFETPETITIASTSKAYQISSVSSVPLIPERATSVSILTTVLPKAEDADPVASMEVGMEVLRSSNRKFGNPRKHASFNCLEREMYRFYGDSRDCRLFHYCSPGFTSRQVLDFRFVCEEGTAFDEVTQSCRHDVRNRKCRNRW